MRTRAPATRPPSAWLLRPSGRTADTGSLHLRLEPLHRAHERTSVNSNQKGNVAELAIAKEAARAGLAVFTPLTEHERYDLVIGIGGRLLRVQCKWAKKVGDVVAVNLASSRRGPDGFVRRAYAPEEIDAVGAYCSELDKCYLIPIERIAGQWRLRLRLAPARNGQRAALHFADDFRLGAVAQLEERCHGMAEVRGSSPLSSTDSVIAPPTHHRSGHTSSGIGLATTWSAQQLARPS